MSPPIIVALSSTKSYAHSYLILVLKLATLAHSPFCETPHTSAHLSLLKPCHCLVLDQGHFFHDLSWSLWYCVISNSYASHYQLAPLVTLDIWNVPFIIIPYEFISCMNSWVLWSRSYSYSSLQHLAQCIECNTYFTSVYWI